MKHLYWEKFRQNMKMMLFSRKQKNSKQILEKILRKMENVRTNKGFFNKKNDFFGMIWSLIF